MLANLSIILYPLWSVFGLTFPQIHITMKRPAFHMPVFINLYKEPTFMVKVPVLASATESSNKGQQHLENFVPDKS